MVNTSLKKARVLAQLTQKEVAEKLGVSQPNYQRWESGKLTVPANKVSKLSKILGTSSNDVLGKLKPFDFFGIDPLIDDDRRYFGEVAIHFVSGNPPLLLSTSYGVCNRLRRGLEEDRRFVVVESLDNRMVLIPRESIADVYFSTDACDSYGPESYDDNEHLGTFPDDDFWQVVAALDSLDALDCEFDQALIDLVREIVVLNDAVLNEEMLIEKFSEETRKQKRALADEKTRRFQDRARNVSWRLTSGQRREEFVVESTYIYDAFFAITDFPEANHGFIDLCVEIRLRSIVINPGAIDFIIIPAQRFREGELARLEEHLVESGD